jgi:beta-fructofuranosidase
MFSRYVDGLPVGDVIPFYDDGTFHLFCLTPPPGALLFPERLRTAWRHLRSTDLVRWEELPEALVPGGDGDPDRDGVWTGSVLRATDELHVFYTGHTLAGDIPQSICHATSADGVVWYKDSGNPLLVADRDRFEGKDWRDPFVFWNEGEGRYWMLLSSRSVSHPAVSRGVVALCTSDDLASWSHAEVLYEAFLTHCPECPEIFRLGEKWVMAYSRFTDRRGTVYRFADDPRGPWHSFDAERPDGPNWYAAKSLTDDRGRRIAFGWIPDRNPAPSADTGHWLWAGDLAIPRQLELDNRGQLGLHPPVEMYANAKREVPYVTSAGTGRWTAEPGEEGGCFDVEAIGQFGFYFLRPTEVADQYIVSMTVCDAANAAIVGLAVQTGEQLDRGFAVLFYPSQHEVRGVDLSAARSEVANEYEKSVTEYAPVAEHCLAEEDFQAVTVRVVVRGDLVEAFVADAVCLSYRLTSRDPGGVALLIQDGSARFVNVRSQLIADGP